MELLLVSELWNEFILMSCWYSGNWTGLGRVL